MNRLPRRPILLDTAFDDLKSIERLIETLAPYWPVQRYFSNEAEYGALSGAQPVETMVVAPIFRGNWATDGEASADVRPLLRHQPFLDAARRLFNTEVVRPQNVYVNLTWQLRIRACIRDSQRGVGGSGQGLIPRVPSTTPAYPGYSHESGYMR